MAHRGRHAADDLLAAHLAAGLTVRDAAARAGVSERTATRRAADRAFQRRVRELRAEAVTAAAGRLADGMGEAAAALRALLADADAGVRLRAAAKLLELGLKAQAAVELEQRVRDLERAAGEPGGDDDAEEPD